MRGVHAVAVALVVVASVAVLPASAFAHPALSPSATLAGVGVDADVDVAPAVNATGPCAGRITDTANAVTLVSIQGARFGENGGKTPARIVAFGPHGEIEWVHHSGTEHGVVWSYDIDPLPNGNVFVTATQRGTTLFYELDPETGERLWVEELDITDTHDADMLSSKRIVVANMRNYDEESDTNDDRVFVYNRETGEIEWEWRFAPHYPKSVGGNYTDDWTHVNDVEAVGDSHFLLSPRNFDQVILVNRETGEIDLKLGSDGEFSVLRKQHNPDYLESADGDPTFLVADSDNERIVEYEHTGEGWNRTWNIGNGSTLSWPRDADRLRNGNTLVGDSKNNRVIEVTPEGNVVWEAYAPWLVYDVERVPRDESDGPTIRDLNATGAYDLRNATPPETAELEACDEALTDQLGGFGVDNGPPNDVTPTADDSTGGFRTETTTESAGFGAVVATMALLIAALLARRREDL